MTNQPIPPTGRRNSSISSTRIGETGSRRPVRVLALVALLAPLLAACSADAPGAGWAGSVDTLPGGTIHVRNAAIGLWGEDEGWQLVEDLRIGRLDGDGPDVFGDVTAFEVDDLGRIFVLDRQAREVRVFDADGRHVRSFGGSGAGPGELGNPIGLVWAVDGWLWIPDPGNARYSVFDTAGAFVTTHVRPMTFHMMPWPGGVDPDGHVFDVAPIDAMAAGASPLGLVRFTGDMQPTDTIPLPHYVSRAWELTDAQGRMRSRVVIPFATSLVWRLDGRGHVWFAITDAYRVYQQRLGGDTLRIIEREATPLPVTRAERDAALTGYDRFIEQGFRIDPSDIPSEKPLLRALFVDDAGHLWVRPTTESQDEFHRSFDIFDPDGRYLGRIFADTNVGWFPPPIVRDGALYSVVRDELGVQYLTRHRIVADAAR